MVCEMDEAGLLNSMTTEELTETCKRLQRSCQDMATLLSEFEQEQEMLYREQDRLQKRVEKVAAQASRGKRKEDSSRGILRSLLGEVDAQLEVSKIFKTKAQRQAAKRRRMRPVDQNAVKETPGEEKDVGLWTSEAAVNASRQPQLTKGSDIISLEKWVREALCADSVAEADSTAARLLMEAGAALVDNSLHSPVVSRDDGHATTDTSGMERTDSWNVLQLEESLARSPAKSSPLPVDREPQQAHSSESDEDAGYGATLSQGLTRVSQILGYVDLLYRSNTEEAPGSSVTVVLRREDEHKIWGLGWIKEVLDQRDQRIVRKCVQDSVAAEYNRQQEARGHPELCIQAEDQLVSANGKTSPADIKEELSLGRKEVVLEFFRAAPSPSSPTASGAPQAAPEAPAASPHPPSPPLARAPSGQQKVSFREVFKARMQAKAPASAATPNGTDSVASTPAVAASEVAPSAVDEPPVAPAGEEVGADGGAVELDRPRRHDSPHGVVVQVLSLRAGSLRLSWHFDWEQAAAPTELRDTASRFFEVRQTAEGTSRRPGDEATEPESNVVRRRCAKPQLKLDLPVGSRYAFEVQALLLPSGEKGEVEGSGDAELPPPLWASPPSSPPVLADLRGPANIPSSASRALPYPSTPGSSATGAGADASPAGAGARPGSSMAAALAMAGPTTPPSSPQSRGGLGEATAPSPQAKKGTVASALASFAARQQQQQQAPLQPREQTRARPRPPQEAGSVAPSSSSSAAPGAAEDPLAMAAPKVVVARPLQPEVEKREIAERLRIRRGGPSTAWDGSQALPRGHSIDSDEAGSLQQLANALSSLERNAAERLSTSGPIDIGTAEEASWQLGEVPPANVSSPFRPSAAAPASAKDVSRSLPIPMPAAAAEEAGLPSPPHSPRSAEGAGDAAGSEVPAERSAPGTCRLALVLVDGQSDTLEFGPDLRREERLPLVEAFVRRNRLRSDLVAEPLLLRMELMVNAGVAQDRVDVVDLF